MRKKLADRIVFLIFTIFIVFSFLLLREKINYLISRKQAILPFAKIDKNKIIKIIFEDENKKTEIYKKNDHWYLKKDGSEFKADEERIKKTIDALVSLKKEEIISKNKNKHKNFGIDKRKVTFYVNKNKFSIYIGNSVNFASNFIRFDDDEAIFLAENLNDIFSDVDWRDLKVKLINDQEKINSIEINYLSKGKNIILVKEKNNWKINEKNAKKERVDFFINDLITLKADDIITQENFTLLNPEITINVKENNQLKKTSIFSIDTNYYLLKIEGNKLIYKIKKIYISSLEKDEDDFIQ